MEGERKGERRKWGRWRADEYEQKHSRRLAVDEGMRVMGVMRVHACVRSAELKFSFTSKPQFIHITVPLYSKIFIFSSPVCISKSQL